MEKERYIIITDRLNTKENLKTGLFMDVVQNMILTEQRRIQANGKMAIMHINV